MADTLSRGPDREPSRWTSPFALAAAGIVIVAFALLARAVFDRPASHHRAAAPPTQAAAGPLPQPLPVPFGVTVSRDRKLGEPDRFAGLAAGPGRTRLLLTGQRPGWLTADGGFQPVTGLPPALSGYEFTRLAGGWAAQRYNPPQAYCQECDAPPAIYYLSASGGRATYVGAAYAAAAAVRPGELWLTAYLPDAELQTAPGTAQLVTVSGRALGRPVRLPAGYVIDAAVSGGLLLQPYSPAAGPVRTELWNPVTRRIRREFTGVIAAGPGSIAWDRCPGKCPLSVLNLVTGARLTVSLAVFGPGSRADAGTFSADGRLLAVQVSTGQVTRLGVISAASGRLTMLRGTTISSLIGESFGWPGGDVLRAALAVPGGEVQVASWQPRSRYLSVRQERLPAGTVPVLGDHG
jgi:hypothetical protein